jgi:hypothetical protein
VSAAFLIALALWGLWATLAALLRALWPEHQPEHVGRSWAVALVVLCVLTLTSPLWGTLALVLVSLHNGRP